MKNNSIKLIFLGTTTFSAKALKVIYNLPNIEIIAVISQPNNSKNRKNEIIETPVAKLSKLLNLNLIQPHAIIKCYQEIKALQPDVLLTCAYGQIIPIKILNLTKKINLNIHGSLLPKYRGGAPIQRCLINRDEETGICLMEMIQKMDAGNVFAFEKIKISKQETASSLFLKMENNLLPLCKNLIKIINQNITPNIQEESKVTYAWNIKPEEEYINWHKSAADIDSLIRALYDKPIAKTILNKIVFKVHQAKIYDGIIENNHQFQEGEIVKVNKQGIIVKCGFNSYLLIKLIQKAGKITSKASNYQNFNNKKNFFENLKL